MNSTPQSLFSSLCMLKTPEEFEVFFSDLCTPKEIEALKLRWTAAQLINQGHTIREVNTLTNASTTTITRVNRCLHYGQGYRQLLNKLTANNTN